MEKPHFLLCNDDGIHAPGIRYLWEAVKDFADITIVAPTAEKSGAGSSISLWHPLLVEKVSWKEPNVNAWGINGTPADCIKMALSVVLERPPTMILSGINKGSNAGRNVLSSGTVGAVIDATMRNLPGIAFSCNDEEGPPNFEQAIPFVRSITQYVLKNPVTKGTFFNVNIPEGEIVGIRLARQGKGCWFEDPHVRQHPKGSTYYWLGGKLFACEESPDSDTSLLRQGFITVVPIHIDDLTDDHELAKHQNSFDMHFTPSGVVQENG